MPNPGVEASGLCMMPTFFRLDKMLKWSTDYFMGAHKSGGTLLGLEVLTNHFYVFLPDCEFVGQIGNGGVDHGFWGRPEEMTMNRFFSYFS